MVFALNAIFNYHQLASLGWCPWVISSQKILGTWHYQTLFMITLGNMSHIWLVKYCGGAEVECVDHLPGRKLCALGPGFNLFTRENKTREGGKEGKGERARWRKRGLYLHRVQLHRKSHPDRPSHWERDRWKRRRVGGTGGTGGGEMKDSGQDWWRKVGFLRVFNGVMCHHVAI